MAGFSKTNIKKHLAIPMTSLLEEEENIENLKSFSNLDDDDIDTLKYFLKDVFNTVDNIKTNSSNNQQKNDIDFNKLYELLAEKIQEKGEKFEIIIEKIKKIINTETELEIDYDVLKEKIKKNFGESEKSQKSKSRTSKKSQITSKSQTSKKSIHNFSMKGGDEYKNIDTIYQNGGAISETVVLCVFVLISAFILQSILKILSSINIRNSPIIRPRNRSGHRSRSGHRNRSITTNYENIRDYMINMCLFLKRMFSRYMEQRYMEQQEENSQYAECPVCMVKIQETNNCRACSICHHKWHAICFPGTQRMELKKCPMCRSINTEVCRDTFDYFLNPAPQPIAPATQPIAPATQPIATRRPSSVKDFFVELMRALLCFPDVDSIQNTATVTIQVIRRNSSGGKYKTRKTKRKRKSLK
jgi:hypothetical protein